jgi:prepilin-type N-terminal cleavage/methylation domain-containing protein
MPRHHPARPLRRPSRPKRLADHAPGVARSGLTLVEMMVAVVVLAVGLLGLASTSAVVTRQVGGGARQSMAAGVIQSRLEWIRSMPCDAIEDDEAETRGVGERWTRGDLANGILSVELTATFSVAGHERVRVYTVPVYC